MRRELRLLETLSRAPKGSDNPCARLSVRATAGEMAARSSAQLLLMVGLASMLLAFFFGLTVAARCQRGAVVRLRTGARGEEGGVH